MSSSKDTHCGSALSCGLTCPFDFDGGALATESTVCKGSSTSPVASDFFGSKNIGSLPVPIISLRSSHFHIPVDLETGTLEVEMDFDFAHSIFCRRMPGWTVLSICVQMSMNECEC